MRISRTRRGFIPRLPWNSYRTSSLFSNRRFPIWSRNVLEETAIRRDGRHAAAPPVAESLCGFAPEPGRVQTYRGRTRTPPATAGSSGGTDHRPSNLSPSSAEFSRHVSGFDPVYSGKAYRRHSFADSPYAGKYAAFHARYHDRVDGHTGALREGCHRSVFQ